SVAESQSSLSSALRGKIRAPPSPCRYMFSLAMWGELRRVNHIDTNNVVVGDLSLQLCFLSTGETFPLDLSPHIRERVDKESPAAATGINDRVGMVSALAIGYVDLKLA